MLLYRNLNASTFLLGKLQSLQERCLRICLNVHDKNNVNDLHNRAGVAKLGDRREMHVNNFMYCELGRNGHLVKKARSNIQTGVKAAPCFTVAKTNNETFKHGLHYVGAVQWNSLLAKIRNENSFFSFKSKQKNNVNKLVYLKFYDYDTLVKLGLLSLSLFVNCLSKCKLYCCNDETQLFNLMSPTSLNQLIKFTNIFSSNYRVCTNMLN